MKARSRSPISDGKLAQVMYVCKNVFMYYDFQGYFII